MQGPVACTRSLSLTTYTRLTLWVEDQFQDVSMAQALMRFVPGTSATSIVQFVKALAVFACPQAPLVRHQTACTCLLSFAVPFTVNTALLHRCPDTGLVT